MIGKVAANAKRIIQGHVMLTHHLTLVQLKSIFVAGDGRIVEVSDGLHPDDAVKAGFNQIIAATITVEGLGYHFQRLYTSSEIPISKFLYEAWTNNEITFGVPDKLVVDKNINFVINLEKLLSQICSTPPQLTVSSHQKYSGSKKAAQNVYTASSLKPHADPTSLDPITIDSFFADLERARKGESTEERRALLETLRARECSRPEPLRSEALIPVEEWMRVAAYRIDKINSSQRLISHDFDHDVERYIIGLKDIGPEIAASKGRRLIFITECEGLMRCLWSLNFDTKIRLANAVGIEDFREFLWGQEPVTKEQLETIKYYVIDNVQILYVSHPAALERTLDFIGATVLRRAELLVPRDELHGKRYLVYEVSIENAEKLLLVEIKAECARECLPLLDLATSNQQTFREDVRNVKYLHGNQSALFSMLEQDLNDSEEWADLKHAQPEVESGETTYKLQAIEKTETSTSIDTIDPELLVTAFQALYRERAAAYKTVCTACKLSGKPIPEPSLFGLEVVINTLFKLDALPDH